MVIILFLLGIEKVMVELRVDGITQALLIKAVYVRMQLFVPLV